MSLPAGQQRTLHQIERVLQASEPHLVSKFAIFARLASSDGPIGRERIHPPRFRLTPRFRAVMLAPVTIGLLIIGIVLGGTAHGSGGCLHGWHSIPASPARGGADCGLVMRPAHQEMTQPPPGPRPPLPSRYMRNMPDPG